MVETFFKTLKSELVWRTMFYTRQEADQVIGRYIDGFYNPVRRHSALDFTSPAQFKKMAAEWADLLSTKARQSPKPIAPGWVGHRAGIFPPEEFGKLAAEGRVGTWRGDGR
jgi:hypothetical protein